MEGKIDGKSLRCQSYQPTSLCVEFDNVVYVTNYPKSCIKVFASLRHTFEFHAAIGNLM